MVAYSFTTYALVSEMIHKEIKTKKAVFFDLDGVITIGLMPTKEDIIVTGRSIQEQPETERYLKKRKNGYR